MIFVDGKQVHAGRRTRRPGGRGPATDEPGVNQ